MNTGNKLRSKFQHGIIGKKGEIDFFREFIIAFNSLGPDAISKEYHGNKYQVTFKEGRGAGRANPRCELCDVVIIQYDSGSPSTARITFNQAKVTSNYFGCDSTAFTKSPYKFSADLEQWDLLSNRPDLNQVVRTFSPPKKLLSGAILPSVGSFGVFYPSHNSYEFAYFVANELYPLTNNHRKQGKLCLKTTIFTISQKDNYEDTSGACCFSSFGYALEQGLVGTPIIELLNQPGGNGDEIKIWLTKMLKGLQRDFPESELPKELMRGLELQQILSDINNEENSGRNLSVKAVALIRTGRR
jgi:hypothetical protein